MTFKYEGAGWYKMRNGDKVYVVGQVPSEAKFEDGEVFLGKHGDDAFAWLSNGLYHSHNIPSEYDLIRKLPEKKTLWVNVYEDTFATHKTKRWADDKAAYDRIARIKVEYEEGQFDE